MNILVKGKKYLRMASVQNVTNGYGFLERYLAAKRAKLAHSLISDKHRRGGILDIGCGSYPIFLLTSRFVERFGFDKNHNIAAGVKKRLKLINYDIGSNPRFAFNNSSMEAVTMLAVMEHIEHSNLADIMSEIYRVLKPGGICVITIPSPWSPFILHIMANLNMVSRAELKDHKPILGNAKILELLNRAGFSDVKYGYFEFYFNRWFLARKR